MIEEVKKPIPWITPEWIKNFPDCIIPEINGREIFERSRKNISVNNNNQGEHHD